MRRLLKLAERIGQPVVLRYEPRRGRHREEQGFPKFGSGQWSVAIDHPTTGEGNDKRKMRGLGAGHTRREAIDRTERAVEAMLADEALRQRMEHDDDAEASR